MGAKHNISDPALYSFAMEAGRSKQLLLIEKHSQVVLAIEPWVHYHRKL